MKNSLKRKRRRMKYPRNLRSNQHQKRELKKKKSKKKRKVTKSLKPNT